MDFEIDHLMIEVDDPNKVAEEFCNKFGLPLAWQYSQSSDYDSIGINFGDINIEFINFRKRFGVNEKFVGLSGVALTTDSSLESSLEYFDRNSITYKIGEDIAQHTTVPFEYKDIYPTLFVVNYKFDTQGWKERLNKEFNDCHGGKYSLSRFTRLTIDHAILSELQINKLESITNNLNTLYFESLNEEYKGIVIYENADLNLRIITE